MVLGQKLAFCRIDPACNPLAPKGFHQIFDQDTREAFPQSGLRNSRIQPGQASSMSKRSLTPTALSLPREGIKRHPPLRGMQRRVIFEIRLEPG